MKKKEKTASQRAGGVKPPPNRVAPQGVAAQLSDALKKSNTIKDQLPIHQELDHPTSQQQLFTKTDQ